MRLRNWTPSLVAARFATWVYQVQHPGFPWLSPRVNDFLLLWLKKDDFGLEFGSGRSTVWFAQRVGFLISVEHNLRWYRKVKSWLEQRKIDNCDYIFAPTTFTPDEHLHQQGTTYVSVVDRLADDSLDFALVDGVYRGACVDRLLAKIRPGGLLIIDDSQDYYWYLVGSTGCIPCINPEPGSKCWSSILQHLSGWRQMRVDTRLKTTDIYIKPHKIV